MKRSKKHHFVPKALLRNFCVAGESTYFLRKEATNHQPKLRNIDSIFHRRHYNSYQKADGDKDDRLEKFFAFELDNYLPDWVGVFTNALATGEIDFPSQELKSRFVHFFYHHINRTPEFSEPLVEKSRKEVFSEEGLASLESRFRPLTSSEREKFHSPSFQHDVTWNSRVHNMGQYSQNVIRILEGMKVSVATPERSNKQFIVGSSPVVRFENHVYQELGTTGVELWTTLSPRIAVGFASPEGPVADVHSLPDHYVRQLNTQIAKRSTSIASKSPKLLASLAKAVW